MHELTSQYRRTAITSKLTGKRASAVSTTLPQPEGVTILRPIKSPGKFKTEAHLIECLLSTVRQQYPLFEIIFSVADTDDAAIPGIRELIRSNPDVDITLIIGEERIGLNPKINNLIRSWRRAKYDLIWIVDSNVWVEPGALGRTVDVLNGLSPQLDTSSNDAAHNGKSSRRPAKFVHHLPICINATSTDEQLKPWASRLNSLGCALEEAFMSSSHCKFYCGINTVAIAPCIIGKSNMFRKSHLEELCPPVDGSEGGLASFSDKLCEDHLIAEKLWIHTLKDEIAYNEVHNTNKGYIRHQLLNEPCYQPMSGMTVADYWSRRTRWLKVRKYSVLIANIVEPGTESFVGSLIGGLGLQYLGLLPNNLTLAQFWFANIVAWCLGDWLLYLSIHRYETVNLKNPDVPVWLAGGRRRSFFTWFLQWLGRELMALPIWFEGMFGRSVNWRGHDFSVSTAGVKEGRK